MQDDRQRATGILLDINSAKSAVKTNSLEESTNTAIRNIVIT